MTATQSAISFQSDAVLIDDEGKPTVAGVRLLELLTYHTGNIIESAREYEALDAGTATNNEIATALNTFMASVIAT